MTHSTLQTRSKRLARFSMGVAAAVLIGGATLAPAVLAQIQPAETVLAQTETANALPLTVAETEGPYFKAGSPEATDLVQDGMSGQMITITGQVLDQNGQPVANALVDFWQADSAGTYDNTGYTLRGHQYTDANGYYTLTTVVPGIYPGRTEHIHVKVQAPGGPLLTTQLFFPGVAQNARDGIYDPSLLLNITDPGDGSLSGTYNFVVATA